MKLYDTLSRLLAAREYELRFETDPVEMDHIANDRDRIKRKLDLIVRVEVANDLSEADLAWIAETEAKLADLERRAAAGEQVDMHGWLSENWIAKMQSMLPLDCDGLIDGKESRGLLDEDGNVI